MARLNCYLSNDELAWVRSKERGWLRQVVRREMDGVPPTPAPVADAKPEPPAVVPVAPAPREPADSDQFGRPHCKNCGAVLTIKEKCLVCGAKQ
jgi:hypothetical protein